MANRMFFFIALPGTIICFIAYTMVVFTPKYMTYDAPLPSGMKDGDKVQSYTMGAIQNCTKNGTFSSVAVKAKVAKKATKKKTVVIVRRSLEETGGGKEVKEFVKSEVPMVEEVKSEEASVEAGIEEEGEVEVPTMDTVPIEKVEEVEEEVVEEEEEAAKVEPAKKAAAPAKKAAAPAKKAPAPAKKAPAKGKKTAVKGKKAVVVKGPKGPPTDPTKVHFGKWDCHLLNWKMLTNQLFLAYLSTTAVAWFTLLGAFLVSLVKVILDWVPHDKIKAARILCSRNFGLGLMSAHITAGGMIIASSVLMIVIWKTTLAAAGWKLGFNIYLGLGVAVGSFFTAIMWFMDVKKMGLIPI